MGDAQDMYVPIVVSRSHQADAFRPCAGFLWFLPAWTSSLQRACSGSLEMRHPRTSRTPPPGSNGLNCRSTGASCGSSLHCHASSVPKAANAALFWCLASPQILDQHTELRPEWPALMELLLHPVYSPSWQIAVEKEFLARRQSQCICWNWAGIQSGLGEAVHAAQYRIA